jgi:CRISPR-associated protein (TIGR02710 family)
VNTVLVISIGKSPDPCLASVQQHNAKRVIFFASQETRAFVTDIERVLEMRGELVALEKDDEYDFERCYQTARVAVQKALSTPEPRRIVVDITGGTKTMVAALALAASDHQLEFAYVVSDKQPDGTFKHNSEQVKPFSNPLHKYHIRELERLQNSFNTGDFRVCLEIVGVILERSQEDDFDAAFFEALGKLIRAFERWDLFNHREAADVFVSAMKLLKPLSSARPGAWRDWLLEVAKLETPLLALKAAQKASERVLLQDLLANADRRIARGEYDDAVARLYRAVDLYSEILLEEVGVVVSGTRLTLKDEQLWAMREFAPHQQRPPNVLKLGGVYEIARLAALLAPKLGEPWFESIDKGKLSHVLDKRNQSILAHGFEPVSESTATGLRRVLQEEFALESFPVWTPMPRLI